MFITQYIKNFLDWGKDGQTQLAHLRHATLNACGAAYISIISALFLLRMLQGRFLIAGIEFIAIALAVFALWYSKRGRFDISVLFVAISPVVLSFVLVMLGLFMNAEMVPQMAMCMVTFTLVFEKNGYRLLYIFVCLLLMAIAVFSQEGTAFQVVSFVIQAIGFAFVFLCFVSFFERQDDNLQRSIGLLKQSNIDKNKANELLRERVEELLVFSHVMGHDIKEPLMAIRRYADILQDSDREYPPEVQHREALSAISSSVDNINHLVSDLLAYSRTSLGESEAESVNLTNALNAAMSMLDEQIDSSNVEILTSELPTVSGNLGMYRTVFYNLLSNAITYQPGDPKHRPRVRVWAQAGPDRWMIHIADNGVGIKSEFLPNLFSAFKRDRVQEHKGSGMGMSICRSVLERFGGTIEVESTSAKGTTFVLSFPRD